MPRGNEIIHIVIEIKIQKKRPLKLKGLLSLSIRIDI
tara:strand:- start:2693 stop:2803 length:111 start_codon:yes stop_codon:yes gene_type:complete